MSYKEKIRNLKTDLCTFEIYLVRPEPADSFRLPYAIAIPTELSDGTKLIVESSNVKNISNDDGVLVDWSQDEGKNLIIKSVIDTLIGNNGSISKINLAKLVSAPYLIPILPSFNSNSANYQELSKECFDESNTSSELYRIDEQLCSMIEDAQNAISEKGFTLNPKIFLTGYDSTGIFAQRFAFLHPELVDTLLVGGSADCIPMPSDCNGSNLLDYPLGTKNFEKLTGKSFDLDSYHKINIQHYLGKCGDITENSTPENKFELYTSKPDITMSSSSVPAQDGKLFRKLYGKNLWKRYKNQIEEYENKGYHISVRLYEELIHSNTSIPSDEFIYVYNGMHSLESSREFNNHSIQRTLFVTRLKLKSFFMNLFSKNHSTKQLSSSSPLIEEEYNRMIQHFRFDELRQDFHNYAQSVGLSSSLDNFLNKYGYNSPNTQTESILQAHINQVQIVELAQNFFKSIDPTLSNEAHRILTGKSKSDGNRYIDLQFYPSSKMLYYYNTEYDINEKGYYLCSENATVTKPQQNKSDLLIHIPLNNTLQDLYKLVHEITHTFTISSSNTNTMVKSLREIAPICMERLLDDFLLSLPEEVLTCYGIDSDSLKHDVNCMYIDRFLGCYNSKTLFYNVAMLYQNQFLKFNHEEKINHLLSFIQDVKNNKFDEANLSLRFKAYTELSRTNYIIDSFNEFKKRANIESPIPFEPSSTSLSKTDRDNDSKSF